MHLPRASLRFVAIATVLAVAASAPYFVWQCEPSRTLEVVVVDETAGSRTDRAPVAWLLRALKIRNRAGRFLDPARDYVGFDPVSRRGRDLVDADLASAEVLFVTEPRRAHAGVDDGPDEQATREQPPQAHSGLSDAEALAIDSFCARGGVILGEFSASALPAGDEARGRLQSIFGVRWTGWEGRYWPNLRDGNEVPRSIGGIYERINGRPFDLSGGGLVFVRDDAEDIVVLRDGEDLPAIAISEERTAGGAVFDFPERGAFARWIDVIDAAASEVLVEHVVGATPAGQAKLAAHGLPGKFPAVTRRWNAWYFAGDFVELSTDFGSPERAALLPFRRISAGCDSAAEEGPFWGWYAPVVSRLLASRASPYTR